LQAVLIALVEEVRKVFERTEGEWVERGMTVLVGMVGE
jgi:hypothetical protein